MSLRLKLPVHDEAERALAGACVLTGERALEQMADVVTPDDFALPDCAAVIHASLALWHRRQPVDVVMIEAELRATERLRLCGGIEGLNRLGDLGTAHVRFLAERVRELGQARRLVTTCAKIVEDAQAAEHLTKEWLDDAERQLFEASRRGMNSTTRTAGQLTQKLYQEFKDAIAGKVRCVVPTNLLGVDDLLTDGFVPGELVILGARPRMGKTAFALKLMQRVSIRHEEEVLRRDTKRILQPCLFFSLEMGHMQLIERITAAETNLPYKLIQRRKNNDGTPMDGDDLRRVVRAFDRIAAGQFWVDDAGGLKLMEMRARARRWRRDRSLFPDDDPRRIGLILVDYLQLARGDNPDPRAPREQEVSYISRGLKELAKELEVPVVALSQLNRDLEKRPDKRPVLSDLRESGAIEQDADRIMFLFREEEYAKTEADKILCRNKAEIIFAKNRNGKADTAHMLFYPETQVWREAV